MTTIAAGQQSTILVPKGQVISIVGMVGASGVAYRLNQILGGTNSVQSYQISSSPSEPIGPFPNSEKFLITCSVGAILATVDAPAAVTYDASGPLFTPLTLGRIIPRGRLVVCGDSLSLHGQPGRCDRNAQFQFATTTVTTPANFGGLTWIAYGMVDGRANGGVALANAGTLASDAQGRLSWAFAGDTAGPAVDVSTGGWFYLESGTLTRHGITVVVRGATAPVLNASSAVQTAGTPVINDYNLTGFAAYIAGMLGDTFSSYEACAIAGATTGDILKFLPQAFQLGTEVAVITAGVNDLPTTSAACVATIANLKSIIDFAASKARFVYVNEIFPDILATPAIVRNLALVSEAIKKYCATKKNVRFVSSFDKLIAPNAYVIGSGAGGRPGAYQADNLHLKPFGAYWAGKGIADAIAKDYAIEPGDRGTVATWDSTLQLGSLNLNPTLRGTAGAVPGTGITGTAPDSWSLNRAGSTQLCTTAFVAAADGGIDFWTMDVSGATAGDYNELSQSVPLPAGVAVGDYVQFACETVVLTTSGAGLNIFNVYAVTNGNLQSAYLLQTSQNVANFTTEAPVLHHRSEPMEILPGVTSFAMRVRAGAAGASAGTGKVGIRKFRFEKCAAPVYA